MCGIAGFTKFKGRTDNPTIRRMTASLVHRGPDQQGCYTADHAALGAVRLQVIDLDGGEQPIRTEDGRYVIVYNGEIYNFAELRRELESLGQQFRSNCDTEVALRAFAQWDTDCFQRFRGMFAMAIWSVLEERLILGRDRLGIKPLYVRRTGQDLVFGSELKALFEHPAVTRVLDRRALQDFLLLNYVPAPRTLVEGIEKLPAGHYLEWRNGETRLTPYWQLRFAPDHSMSEAEAVEELDRLLRDAVKEELVSDVPLGIWASGGVDSSVLVHYAAEAGTKLKTFSMAFESKSCDESEYFRQIAERYGTDHHEFQLTGCAEVLAAVEDFATYSDEPGADAGALPVWFLSKMSRAQVTVALSGEGGDELFGGYLTYQADRLARPLRMLPRAVRRGALGMARVLLPVSNAKIGLEYKLKRWLEGSLLHPDEAHFFWNGSFSSEQKLRLQGGRGADYLRDLFHDIPDGEEIGHINRYLMADQRYYLQDNLLCKVDRMSMAHSLEVRPPLLDHRIVEFAARLPENFKVRGSTGKWILKQAMRRKLPEQILNRSKAGLDIPAHEWFRGPLGPLFREVVTPEAVRRTGIFSEHAVTELMRDHKEKRINVGYQLWGLLTLFLWMKRWNIETSAALETTEEPLHTIAVN
jgi:asparagine synthase (glutamine-hydrolysing)